MAMKHQQGNGKKIAEKNPIRRVIVHHGEYVDALQVAAETYPELRMIDIHTKTSKSGVITRVFLFR